MLLCHILPIYSFNSGHNINLTDIIYFCIYFWMKIKYHLLYHMKNYMLVYVQDICVFMIICSYLDWIVLSFIIVSMFLKVIWHWNINNKSLCFSHSEMQMFIFPYRSGEIAIMSGLSMWSVLHIEVSISDVHVAVNSKKGISVKWLLISPSREKVGRNFSPLLEHELTVYIKLLI